MFYCLQRSGVITPLFTGAIETLCSDHSFTACESLGEAWSKL